MNELFLANWFNMAVVTQHQHQVAAELCKDAPVHDERISTSPLGCQEQSSYRVNHHQFIIEFFIYLFV